MKAGCTAQSLLMLMVGFTSMAQSVLAEGHTIPKLPAVIPIESLDLKDEDDNGGSLGLSQEQLDGISDYVKAKVVEDLQQEGVLNESAEPTVWHQEQRPHLNFVEMTGNFRTRGLFFNNGDLGTSVPGAGIGTSMLPPPLSYYPNEDDDLEDRSNEDHSLYSMDLRLRVEPTLNVSEYIRIKSTVNVFNNMVFGSTPDYMVGVDSPNPSYPLSFLSSTQTAPIVGINGYHGSIEVQRLWGEVQFPFGEFRFGRMPLHFGLGILYNDGSQINDDYNGSNLDTVMLATSILGHYVIPAYAISYSGPTGRGGGLGSNGDNSLPFFPGEDGRRNDLDTADNVHSLFLIIGKQNSALTLRERLESDQAVFDYGLLSSYRFQATDTRYFQVNNDTNQQLKNRIVLRNAHAGIGSIYFGVEYQNFKLQLETSGTVGRIGNAEDLNWDGPSSPLWLLQGGVALKSRYGFFNDKLGIGLDSGIASGNANNTLNSREGLSQQFSANNDTLSTFKFNPNYSVDLILFKEVLGTVAGAAYVKPNISYDITQSLSVRGDVISSFAVYSSSTTGNSSLLGLEFDLSAKYHSAEGFYFLLQYGLLVPFAGLNQPASVSGKSAIYEKYSTAQIAQTVQFLAGITF